MSFKELPAILFPDSQVSSFLEGVQPGLSQDAGPFPGALKSMWITALFKNHPGPMITISPEPRQSEELFSDLEMCGVAPLEFFPALDTLPYERISPNLELVGRRLSTLEKLERGEKLLVTTSIKAVIQKTLPRAMLSRAMLHLKKGEGMSLEYLTAWLLEHGYHRESIVGDRGEFAVRGGILDCYPSHLAHPLRIEFDVNSIASLRLFDSINQISVQEIPEARLLPVREFLLTPDFLQRLDAPESIFDYLPLEAIVMVDDPLACMAKLEQIRDETVKVREDEAQFLGEILPGLRDPQLTHQEYGEMLNRFASINLAYVSRDTQAYSCDLSHLPDLIPPKLEQGFRIIIATQYMHRVSAQLKKEGISVQTPLSIPESQIPGIYLMSGRFQGGFEHLPSRTLLITDVELFPGGRLPVTHREEVPLGVDSSLISHLQEGDFVVHENYGIGRFGGLKKLSWDDEMHEYLLIQYADDAELYVPLHQLELIKKYSWEEGMKPKLGHLGSTQWLKTKARVEKGVQDLTRELLEIYAARKAESGFSFPPDSPWQMDLENSFPFEETPDQLAAATAIKGDMESDRPMDRLLCGDVGYGKTEVALRAAFKAATAGKQVAILVPTTLLAEQHYLTFRERLAPFPIVVEMLSRFRTPAEQTKILERLTTGGIDIIIGTQRLLQKDVRFRDLGLLIIDEEQRFGVVHKERLKKLKKTVDVLTLTATPIPRTLHMSLSGAMDVSQMATPPRDRSPIRTYIVQRGDAIVREAIVREVERGGQVFFVHNRVQTILAVAEWIQKLLPNLRVAVGHGQMASHNLEEVMSKFIQHEYDLLVCTSIIESGLDLPGVNTVLIDQATQFGLADLYQLRGRVGRGSVRAYCYLLYDPHELGKGAAVERLQALQEFTALGSGYKLALRDLEIRGAGNILGREQHGHLVAVGFDLYCEMLQRAADRLKGGEKEPTIRTVLDIKLPARIPEEYIADEGQRIATYQRLSKLQEEREIDYFRNELRDRFGPLPPSVAELLEIVRLKVLANQKGIETIRQIGNVFVMEKQNQKKEFRIAAKDIVQAVDILKQAIEAF